MSFTVPVTGAFDTLVTSEDLTGGQVIGSYTVEARDSATGTWSRLPVHGATVGSRLLDAVGLHSGVDALRWNCSGSLVPPPPATFTNAAGDCLGAPPGEAFPCWSGSAVPGGEVFHLCPLVATRCDASALTTWSAPPGGAWSPVSTPGATVNVDCNACTVGAHAKVMLEASGAFTWDAAAARIRIDACPGMCLTNGVAPGALPSCAGHEPYTAQQVHVDACDAPSTAGWVRADAVGAPAQPPAVVAAFGAYLAVPVVPVGARS